MIEALPPTGEEIKDFLFEHKLTQVQAAKIVMIPIATFERYCRGNTTCWPTTWIGIKYYILKHTAEDEE